MTATETIVINGTKEAAEAIRDAIDAQPDSESQLTPRRNLDGNTAAWIVIANITVQSIPPVLGFLKDYLSAKQVKRIKLGDLEIENPTPNDIERFRAMIDSRSKSE